MDEKIKRGGEKGIHGRRPVARGQDFREQADEAVGDEMKRQVS